MTGKNLAKAIDMLKTKCNVVPEKYSMYNGAYLFLAYPKGLSDKEKERHLSPYYLVDLKQKAVGPFSPAFDIKGFFESVRKQIDI